MTVLRDIAGKLNTAFRPELAESWDRVGLLVGDPDRPIRRIGVALDVDPSVIQKAVSRKIDLLVTHHPPFLGSLDSLLTTDVRAAVACQCLQAKIAVYAAHTNFDVVPHGTSGQLCRKLGVTFISSMIPERKRNDCKIVTFVPPDHLEPIRSALGRAGAGRIGNYDCCSFVTPGTGSFLPQSGANPYIGRVGQLESCEELRLEMVAPGDKISAILSALRRLHPYDEPAVDVVRLRGSVENVGYGAIADLPGSVPAREWLQDVKKRLGVRSLKTYGNNPRKRLRRIAVMPGSGGGFVDRIPSGVDLYLTADIKYHDLTSAARDVILADAGHDATERPCLPAMAGIVKKETGIPTSLIRQKLRTDQMI